MNKAKLIAFVRTNRALIESTGRKIGRVIVTSLGTKGIIDAEWAIFWVSLVGLVVIELWSFYEQSKDGEDSEKPKARGDEGNNQHPV